MAVLKKLVAAFLSKQTLLGEEEERVGIRDYFTANG
jgi:hypothetical protein